VIIDNMMNLELLFEASRHGGTQAMYDAAFNHALMTMKNHFRQDGSTYHVVDYDTVTGAVLARETHQGFSNESVWARGQAWALYGFTMAYRETRNAAFLATAERAADWFVEHLPADRIPYWDFMAPGIPDAARDASAAAIAASGLLELSTFVQDSVKASGYGRIATEMIEALSRPPYLAKETSSFGIINKSTGNHPKNLEVEVSLSYGDYYYLEALSRFRSMNK
jgi:unsaturated chondroitin disaccharide hydrolase